MRRGPVPTWWAEVCHLSVILFVMASVICFVDPYAAVVPVGLGLIGFVIITVVYFRAPRLPRRP